MDGVTKVSKFLQDEVLVLGLCWDFLLVFYKSLHNFTFHPTSPSISFLFFLGVITSFSFSSIIDSLWSNISSRTINVFFNHMHFVVLVSILGILVCILDLICVFCNNSNRFIFNLYCYRQTNMCKVSLSLQKHTDLYNVGWDLHKYANRCNKLVFCVLKLCSNGNHGLENTFYFSLTSHIIVENLCQHMRWKYLTEHLDAIFIGLFNIFCLIIMYYVVLTTH